MSVDLLSPPKAERQWTAGEIKAALQTQFGSGESHAVLFEVRDATGFSASRSIDAVVMTLWPSLGLELWGMEIKVSRSDWKRELAQPEKASRTFEYFDRWFLVAPAHVATREELPAPWGWMQPNDKGVRTVVPAPRNEIPRQLDRKFLAALLRRTSKTDDAFVNARIERALAQQREQHDRDIDHKVLLRIEHGRDDAKAMQELRAALGGDAKYLSQEEIVTATRAVIQAGVAASWQGLHSVRDEARRFADRIDKAIGEMKLPSAEKKRGRK